MNSFYTGFKKLYPTSEIFIQKIKDGIFEIPDKPNDVAIKESHIIIYILKRNKNTLKNFNLESRYDST